MVVRNIIILFLALFVIFTCPYGVFAHEAVTHTVTMTQEGYYPRDFTILQNDTVVFKNTGNVSQWPASNIHPTHNIYPEFDPKKPISPGSSWRFTFKKAGKWRYHDHLLPAVTGTVIVKEDAHGKEPDNKNRGSEAITKFTLFEKVKLSAARLYYQLFPKRVSQKLKDFNIHSLAKDERTITYFLSIFGPTAIMDSLLKD